MSIPLPPTNRLAPPPVIEEDPRLTDNETDLVMRKYLTPKQYDDISIRKFILSYVGCRNALQAAKEAGLSNIYRGNWLRSRPEVHAVIAQLTSMQVMKHGYDSDDVIERVKEIGSIDPVELQNPDGTFKTDLKQIKPEVRRAIKKFEAKNIFEKDANGMDVLRGVLVKVEFWDKMKAIELLGVEKDMFKKTTVVVNDVTDKMADLLLDSSRRADERRIAQALPVREITGSVESDGHNQENRPMGESQVPGQGDRENQT